MKKRIYGYGILAAPLIILLVLLAAVFLTTDPEDLRTARVVGSAGGETAGGPGFQTTDVAALDAFDAWVAGGTYHGESTQGVELARARRSALKELIHEDPQAALERAVPYSVRRRLPQPVVALLETPVSTVADLDVEQACGGTGGISRREGWLTLDDQRVQVFSYGDRADVMTKEKLSVHGIAIDDVMAMLDDPLRELSPEEVADSGFTGRVVQLGKRLFAVESNAALEAARQQLRGTEEVLGPSALPAYRRLAAGQMDGLYPLAMQGGAGGSDDDLPPVAFSPWTEGAKTMLYIRARFADEAPTYEPVSFTGARTNQDMAETFWKENSYGKSTLTTTITTEVVTLPKNGGGYVNNFGTLLADARQAALAANPAWNHNNFNFYTVVTNFATNSQGQGFNYSGVAQVGGAGSHLLRTFISVRTASHEYGHNLGLNHSEYWLTDSPSPIGRDSIPGGYVGDTANDERIEYGHKFAVMGGQFGGAFEEGRAHYTVGDKSKLDWLANSNVITTTNSGTYRLFRHDVPESLLGSMSNNVARAIKIDLPATTPAGISPPYKYWLNYRWLTHDGIATTYLRNGIQVDWRRDDSQARSVMLDMTPYSRDSGPYGATPGYSADNGDKEDGVLLIGRTFSDTAAGIHFTPIARGTNAPNEWLDIVINIGTQSNNIAPAISSFTVSDTNPAVGANVNFAVTATDTIGDTLAYHWDMGDNSIQPSILNQPTRSKSWTNAGLYTVRVEVSDMKGGKTTASQLIRVGSPTDNGTIQGRVAQAGRPVEGALVRAGAISAWTESDGSYVLAGLPIGSTTVTAVKDGLTFTPRFTNPVPVTEFNTFGADFTVNEPWTGGGGTVASIRPYQLTLPVGFAAPFAAHAFDGSGNPVAFNPAWSVSGGGVISSNGVFHAQSAGGPFVVTAQDGSVTATAAITVVPTAAGPSTSGTWINSAGGSWSTNTNWAGGPPGIIAGGANLTADFNTLNITSDTTVNLDGGRMIGNMVFGDTTTASAGSWIVANGTGGYLTLAGTNPTITVNALGSGKFATVTAQLHGLNGFTKTGPGNLLLDNANNPISGAIVISGGNIQLNNASLRNATSVAINSGSLVVATTASNAVGGTIVFGGGTLQFNSSPGSDYSANFSSATNQPYRISLTAASEATFSSSLISEGGSLTKLGAGRLILAAPNTYNGGTTLAGGTVTFNHASALAGGPVTFTANTVLQAGLSATLTNAVSVANGIVGTIDSGSNSITLSGFLSGAGGLIKTGSGTLNISGGGAANALSGPIVVNAGTLANDNITPSPGIQSLANMNGSISVAAGATFSFSQSFTAEPLDDAITLSGQGTGGLGALNLWRNATASGQITLAADSTISHSFNTATITGSITGSDRSLTLITTVANQPGMTVSGPINLGAGGITVQGATNSGNFSIRLSGNNNYTGETRVVSGTLMLSGSSRIDDSATVRLAVGTVLHLDFTGADHVGALVLDGATMPAGTYGSLTSNATNKSAYFQGGGILQVGAADDYGSWAALEGVSGGSSGDHDNDGVSNLVEYALFDGGERGSLNGHVITFTKRGAPYGQDLTYIIEISETLEPGSWVAAVTHGPAQLGLPISYDLAPAPGTRKRFARLKVVLAQ